MNNNHAADSCNIHLAAVEANPSQREGIQQQGPKWHTRPWWNEEKGLQHRSTGQSVRSGQKNKHPAFSQGEGHSYGFSSNFETA